jgi:hypothetical protein
VHRREVLLPAGVDAVLIEDDVSMEASAPVELVWPFAFADARVLAADGHERALFRHVQWQALKPVWDLDRLLRVDLDDETSCLVAVAASAPWTEELEESLWSPGYGEVRSGATWRVRLAGVGAIHVSTAFVVTRVRAASPNPRESP